jgi:hypothetical protein
MAGIPVGGDAALNISNIAAATTALSRRESLSANRYPDDTALILALYPSGRTVARETEKIAALCNRTTGIGILVCNPRAGLCPQRPSAAMGGLAINR